ncbi:MAG: hypothetical protein F4032_22250 [Gemmatimonadetes bacterium]|nr:hypothetical protein [Gemmatimonadota bacterium]
MALSPAYVQVNRQISDFFSKLQEGQAPDQFTQQHLKDIGYPSSSHRALIPLMKSLEFLTPEGVPTSRYHEYRNRAQARRIMGEALRGAYSDLFLIKEKPSEDDRDLIEGKFKSTYNSTDRIAKLRANTFFALMGIADLDHSPKSKPSPPTKTSDKSKTENPPPASQTDPQRQPQSQKPGSQIPPPPPASDPPSLHYNIQIHLPATKDLEVYNAIFKSLKEHLLE